MEHICIIIRSLANGGAEKQSLLLAKALKVHHQTHLVVLSEQPAHEKHLAYIEKEQIDNLFLKGNLANKAKNFIAFLKANQIRTIFSYLPSDILFAALTGSVAGVPFIYGGVRNAEMPTKKFRVLKFLHNKILYRSISNCYSGRRNFIDKGFNAEKMIVIPNGLELDNAFIERPDTREIRILSVGRFVTQKDYFTAIESIALLSKKIVEPFTIKYFIVGYGELENAIKQQIKELQIEDKVELVINPPNIQIYYEEAHIYLCTSLFEGLSNAIMEAMSYSLPVVATVAGDNDQLVKPEENGYLVNTKDVGSIVMYLEKLIYSYEERAIMGKNSYQIIKESYTFQAFQRNYLNLIKSHNKDRTFSVAN